MIGAGLLQPPLHVVVEPGAIADDDRRDDGGGLRAPAADAVGDRAAREGARAATSLPSTQPARARTSTSAPLFTVPTSVVPRRASARSWSGTPGSR